MQVESSVLNHYTKREKKKKVAFDLLEPAFMLTFGLIIYCSLGKEPDAKQH